MNLVQTESLLSSATTAELQMLLLEAKDELQKTQERIKSINNQITTRYQDAAKEKLNQQGKDFGSTTLYEGNLKIQFDFKKKVEWDQDKLVTILNTLDTETAKHYANAKYTIPEAKYTNAPPEIKGVLSEARTVHLQGVSANIEENNNA
tara:strand:- start:53 stop:499 length:447 start_codon:yes stop_codon:yes gene_type:complete